MHPVRNIIPATNTLTENIIQRAPIGIAVIDFDGIYRDVNPAYCRIYGYSFQEFLGQPYTMIFAAEHRMSILARHQAYIRCQVTELKGEFDVVRKDGSRLRVVADSVRIPATNSQGMRLVYVVDITERRQMEQDLLEAQAVQNALFQTSPLGIIYYDPEGRLSSANPAAGRILGLRAEKLIDLPAHDLGWPLIQEDGQALSPHDFPVARVMATREPVRNIIIGIRIAMAPVRWLLFSAMPLWRADSLISIYAWFEDITERVQRDSALVAAASTDYLTGLPNRRTVMDALTREMARLSRFSDQPCAVLLLDIDFFKRVNDHFGHLTGDAVLQAVARGLQAQIRSLDLVGRVGGEEFLIVLPNTTLVDALALADRIRQFIESMPIDFANITHHVTLSIGVSSLCYEDADVSQVCDRADRALYEAKNSGRNQVCSQA